MKSLHVFVRTDTLRKGDVVELVGPGGVEARILPVPNGAATTATNAGPLLGSEGDAREVRAVRTGVMGFGRKQFTLRVTDAATGEQVSADSFAVYVNAAPRPPARVRAVADVHAGRRAFALEPSPDFV